LLSAIFLLLKIAHAHIRNTFTSGQKLTNSTTFYVAVGSIFIAQAQNRLKSDLHLCPVPRISNKIDAAYIHVPCSSQMDAVRAAAKSW